MSTSRVFIIIKGKAKGLMIDKCELASNGVYNVKFNSSPAVYHYRFNDVTIPHECAWHDPAHCKVYINGQLRNDLTDILSFSDGI